MSKTLQKILQSLFPFLLLGALIATVFAIIIMFTYILFWGVLVGTLLWLIALVKNFFFATKTSSTESNGRVIEHHDEDK